MILVDTNVLLDIGTSDARWRDWSAEQLDVARARDEVGIPSVVYAELCVRAASQSEVDEFVRTLELVLVEPTRPAMFLAAKAYGRYRSRGGPRLGVLPDFLIGGQAAASGWTVLTRDPSRYESYFSKVALIAPGPEA